MDLKIFYLCVPLKDPEYVRIPAKYIPKSYMDKHKLWELGIYYTE